MSANPFDFNKTSIQQDWIVYRALPGRSLIEYSVGADFGMMPSFSLCDRAEHPVVFEFFGSNCMHHVHMCTGFDIGDVLRSYSVHVET